MKRSQPLGPFGSTRADPPSRQPRPTPRLSAPSLLLNSRRPAWPPVHTPRSLSAPPPTRRRTTRTRVPVSDASRRTATSTTSRRRHRPFRITSPSTQARRGTPGAPVSTGGRRATTRGGRARRVEEGKVRVGGGTRTRTSMAMARTRRGARAGTCLQVSARLPELELGQLAVGACEGGPQSRSLVAGQRGGCGRDPRRGDRERA